MMIRVVAFFFIAAFSGLSVPVAESLTGQGCSSCSSIESALKDAQNLKVGMTRKDIESHNFVIAGGATFRDHAAYVYKGCEYIKLEVDFKPDPTIERDVSPRDIIAGLSKLTLDYPAKD